ALVVQGAKPWVVPQVRFQTRESHQTRPGRKRTNDLGFAWVVPRRQHVDAGQSLDRLACESVVREHVVGEDAGVGVQAARTTRPTRGKASAIAMAQVRNEAAQFTFADLAGSAHATLDQLANPIVSSLAGTHVTAVSGTLQPLSLLHHSSRSRYQWRGQLVSERGPIHGRTLGVFASRGRTCRRCVGCVMPSSKLHLACLPASAPHDAATRKLHGATTRE